MESAGAFCIPEAERCQHSWRPVGPPWGVDSKKRQSLGPLLSSRRSEPWPVWGTAPGSLRAWSGGPPRLSNLQPLMRPHTSVEPCMLAALKNGLRWGFLKVVSGEAGPWSLPGEGPSELPQARSGTGSPPGWT